MGVNNVIPPDGLAAMAALLEGSDQYQILRRLVALPLFDPASMDQTVRMAAFVDVETTGLDLNADEIIEFALMSFAYSLDGRVLGVSGSFAALRDPGRAIPADVTRLTGISDDMVRGKRIDPDMIADLISPIALVIAHHANFDRRFCERIFPAFAEKAWACSLQEVPWVQEGFTNGTKLSNLTSALGYFFNGHRALDDCQAGIAVLSVRLPGSGRTAMAALLESARRPRWRIWALDAPYAHREVLKVRRYRWHDGRDGAPRAWFTDVHDEQLQGELEYLRRDIYGGFDVNIPHNIITAFDRYSTRS